MSVLSEILAKVLELIRRIWGAVGPEDAPRDVVFARAVPDVVRLTEHYEFEQEISRNPSLDWKAEPSGQIEVTVPYDGSKHFGRQARQDVEEAHKTRRADEVRLGYLLFDNYGGTDLGRVLGLADSYGAMPLCVPMPDDIAEFGADRFTCAIRHDYAPDLAKLKRYPMDVHVDLLDPDNAGLPEANMETSPDPTAIESVPSRIARQVNFRPYLQLRITVVLHLPKPPDGVVLQPKVTKVSLDWPTITSLGGLHLSKGTTGFENKDAPIWYNPLTRGLEWDEVRMDPIAGDPKSDIISFRSLEMNLWVKQPGELYARPSLDGTVEVEIPDYLLSGVQARLSDAGGRMPADRQPELTTTISSGLHLVLDDAFAKRTFMPVQHLHFDEVIPEEERITDITTALSDRGFTITPIDHSTDPERRLLYATKKEGPDEMALWLFVRGRRYDTERKNERPGGQTFTTTLNTGELKVFMGGTLPRDSRELTHEMNALQRALRERFGWLRAPR